MLERVTGQPGVAERERRDASLPFTSDPLTKAAVRAATWGADAARLSACDGYSWGTTVLSVANVPLDPDAPRNFGTLDDISDREDAALRPPPDVVAHLT
jgi:hypothetical protein